MLKFLPIYKLTSIIPVLRTEFLGKENISYRQRLRVLLVNSFEHTVFNSYQRISSFSLLKEGG